MLYSGRLVCLAMSYDTYLNPPKPSCEHCGRDWEYVSGPNPTYNLTAIFDLALTGEGLPNPEVAEVAVVLLGAETDRPRGLRILSGLTGARSITPINNALARLANPELRDAFVALEPPNKWGTVESAVSTLSKLARMANDHPDYVWEIR